MRPLLLRALAWTLLTILLSGLIGRATTQMLERQIASDLVETILDLGLDKHLVQLDAMPPYERPKRIATYPARLASRMTLIDRSNIASSDSMRTVVANRQVWTELEAVYFELEGGQILRIEGATGSFVDVHPSNLVMLAVVLLATLSSLAIMFPVARRLRVLSLASARVAGGDLSVRVDDLGRDAVGELARQFDRMTAAIEAQTREREALFHSVAHELGTPLNRMSLILEMMQRGSEAQRTQRVAQLQQEVDELDALTSELLAWVAEARDRALVPEPIDVVDAVVALTNREPVLAVGVSVENNCHPTLWAEPVGFRRAVDNVLRNARRYAREQIRIRVAETPDTVRVVVEDDGPGVPHAERERIFAPFARVDASRDRTTGGTGLGLAIVARIVERHGGRVEVTRSEALGGAAFDLRWPRSPPALDYRAS